MATENGRASADLSATLYREPYRFDFFQAVRLLERLDWERTADGPGTRRQPVGQDRPPEEEVVRFRTLPSLSFPTSPISQLRPAPNGEPEGQPAPPEMVVSFLGLTGPVGALPPHYTAQILRRLREKDSSLRDFLDVFHHRLLSLFYRAWEKHRLPFAYERWHRDQPGKEPDPVTQVLHSLIGQGTGGLRGRQEVPDEAYLHYAGHWAHRPRSAASLELVLGDYFRLPIEVLQLHGHWLWLEPAEQSRLPTPRQPRGCNICLGQDVVVGERVWDVQSKVRLRVGPLRYEQFCRFLPTDGDALRPLCQMTRSYVGLELAFDVQVVLLPAEVPWLKLGGDGDDRSYLGWNTWVRGREFTDAVDDVVFPAAEA
jgi:type VI secretion system protein ImpH